MRLNKFIADCGVASRRAADKMIADGKIKVNGKTVTELGTVIDENNDTVTAAGERLVLSRRFVYIMLNKPKGCVSTVKDDKDRKTVLDYIGKATNKRIYPVGRLDYDSEGLLLLTNDGDLAYNLTHPSKEVPKTYIVKIEGELTQNELNALRKGVTIEGEVTSPARVFVVGTEEKLTRVEITIHEGKNREIRKMFEAIGKNVVFLKRTAIGDLRLGGLGRGEYKFLSDKEVAILKGLY